MGLKYSLSTRVKSAFSIWNKMETKHVPFEEVYDLYAVRIVFDCCESDNEKTICWSIYSAITDIYKLHPTRTRDWVSTPKANGYRALHLTVMGNDGNWVEVQIRSQKMDDIAERGFAAHWKYKIGESDEESELETWLKTITDLLKEPGPNAVDFLDTIKLNLFATEIIVFTPKGDLVTLPKDATVLDLAYNLHSEIGSHAIAGKVNHRLVPISYKLQSGDQVEVLTSKTQKPVPEWQSFICTAKAKTRLEAALRKERKMLIEKGEKWRKSSRGGVAGRLCAVHIKTDGAFPHHYPRRYVSRYRLRTHRNQREHREVAVQKAESEVAEPPVAFRQKACRRLCPTRCRPFPSEGNRHEKVYVLRSVNGVHNYKIAQCCNPIPGDDVVGYIDDDNNVVVHKMDCETATRLKSSFGNRLVATQWEESPQVTSFMATIHIEGIDRMGILQELIHEISINMSINIRNLNIEANQGVFTCNLVVRVSDAAIVVRMCRQIKKIGGVKSAVRTS